MSRECTWYQRGVYIDFTLRRLPISYPKWVYCYHTDQRPTSVLRAFAGAKSANQFVEVGRTDFYKKRASLSCRFYARRIKGGEILLVGIDRIARVRFPKMSMTISVTSASTWNLVSVCPFKLVLRANFFCNETQFYYKFSSRRICVYIHLRVTHREEPRASAREGIPKDLGSRTIRF